VHVNAAAGPASEPAPLPTPAVLSDAVKAAQTDVEEALRQDRTLERQRDWTGAVGVFQARDTQVTSPSDGSKACASHNKSVCVCAGRRSASFRGQCGKAAAPCRSPCR
jgi:hypothetical protein